jgi:hypothetical protein
LDRTQKEIVSDPLLAAHGKDIHDAAIKVKQKTMESVKKEAQVLTHSPTHSLT